MPFPFDRYPWVNFHELNLAYFIQHFQEIFSQWDELYNGMLEWKADTEEGLETWKNGVMDAIDDWEHDFSAEIQVWQQETEADLTNWKITTLAALDAWKTAAEAQFEAIRVQAAGSASAAAQSAADADTARAAAVAAQTAAEAAAAQIEQLSAAFVRILSGDELTSMNDPSYTFADMPVSRYYTFQGAKLKSMNGGSFPFELSDTGTYVVFCWRYGTTSSTTSGKCYEIFGYSSGIHYMGRIPSGGTLAWIDVSFSGINSRVTANTGNIAQNTADIDALEELTPRYMQLLTPDEVSALNDASYTFADMPVSRYYTVTGAKVKLMNGGSFPFEISDTGYFLLFCWRFGTGSSATSGKAYELFGYASGSHFMGRIPSGGTLAWIDDSSKSAIANIESVISRMKNDSADEIEIYTTFEEFPGWYQNDGTIAQSGQLATRPHTQKLKIRGGHDYYLGGNPSTACRGAFFDEKGEYLAPLYGTTGPSNPFTIIQPSYTPGPDVYVIDQGADDSPDDTTYPLSSYMNLHRFTAPEGAAYLVLNLLQPTATGRYREIVASIPVTLMRDSGNYRFKPEDPSWQHYKNKKLCVIGPSSIMINRLNRTADSGYYVETTRSSGYILGFQEHLRPFFKDMRCFGYSGASYPYGTGATNRISIYTRIVGGTETVNPDQPDGYTRTLEAKDLQDYDVFLLAFSGNGLTAANIGTADSVDKTTYIGAIHGIIQHILSQVPRAEIIIGTASPYVYADPTKTLRANANAIIKEYAKNNGYAVLDFEKGTSENYKSRSSYSYDGSHRNCEGNQRYGFFVRKEIIGF